MNEKRMNMPTRFHRLRQTARAGIHRYLPTSARGALALHVLVMTAALLAAGGRPSRGQQPTMAPAKSPPPPGPRPILKVDSTVHDFGTTWAGTPLEHAFTITNAGDAPLKIIRVQPTCGCTIAGPYPESIQPGASGKFPFSLNTSNVYGSFDKPITVTSNDFATPELRLSLKGFCKRYVEVVPAGAYFMPATEEDTVRVLKVKNNASQPLKLALEPQTPGGKFKFELTETEPGQGFEIRVTLLPPLQPGDLRGMAVIKTNLEAQKTVEVHAFARVPKRIDVSPESVMIVKPVNQSATPPSQLTQMVWVRNYGKTPVHVIEATADEPEMKVTVNQRTPGKTYAVQIQFASTYQPPREGRTLTIKTDDAETPVIRVPIRQWPPAPTTQASRPATTRPATRPTTTASRPAELMAGKPAPAFSLKTLEGKTISNDDFAGKAATILNFVAPNCPHCRKQIPMIEKVRAEYESRNVRFVNMGGTMGRVFTNEEAAAAFKAAGSQMELAPDPGNKIGMLFRATLFPSLFVVNPNGVIARVFVGDRPVVETGLRAQLDTMLGDKAPSDKLAAPAPPSAQAK